MMADWQSDLIYDYVLIVGKAGLQSWDNISTEKYPMHKLGGLKMSLSPYLPPDMPLTCHEEFLLPSPKRKKKKLDEIYDDRMIMTMIKYLRFKYTTWNVRDLGYEDRNYTEYYKKLNRTIFTSNYTVIYCTAHRNTIQFGVMIWIQRKKTIFNKILQIPYG
jgi:hypothetical protein